MKTIYKYPLMITDWQKVELPLRAISLTIQVQNNDPMLWCEIDTEEINKNFRVFRTFATGQPFSKSFVGDYIATYQIKNSEYVFHVYQETE